MDFDAPWCPACDRQILPKTVPSTKRVKLRTPAGKRIIRTKQQRIVVDQGPIPLYCSDECQFADLKIRHNDSAPLDPSRDEKPSHPPTQVDTTSNEPRSSIDRLAALYNFPPLPSPMPVYEESSLVPRQEYSSGIIMAGRLITSLCPPPAKPHTGCYRPVQEPRKPTRGWNDGSNAWRSVVYSRVQNSRGPFHRREGSVPPPPSRFNISLKSASSAPAAYHHPSSPSPRAAEEMITKFSETFIRRSASRVSHFSRNSTQSNTAQNTATLASPVSTHSLPIRRERHLVHPGAQGKLLVPNVTLNVNSGSSNSSAFLSSAWSGPSTTPSSRRSARSPLSATSDSGEETRRSKSIFSPPKRPVENTRAWSYDNVKTYDMMPLPLKKVKMREIRLVDGQEQEVEVEVFEEPKRLFLFAPTTIPQ